MFVCHIYNNHSNMPTNRGKTYTHRESVGKREREGEKRGVCVCQPRPTIILHRGVILYFIPLARVPCVWLPCFSVLVLSESQYTHTHTHAHTREEKGGEDSVGACVSGGSVGRSMGFHGNTIEHRVGS